MFINVTSRLQNKPQAIAIVRGSAEQPHIFGIVKFYQQALGVLVEAEIRGLPKENSFLGFHIHTGGHCDGSATDPLAHVGSHYNPAGVDHPHHAGDLPPLLNNNGCAFSAFLTDRFTLQEIIGKAVIIHASPDDFTTQPSGNSGEKIACGIIECRH